MGLIGTLVIIVLYFITMGILTYKKSNLARRLLESVYWFAIGFWDIISAVYLGAGNPKHYVALGLLFCTVGIICFIIDIVKHYYEGEKSHA